MAGWDGKRTARAEDGAPAGPASQSPAGNRSKQDDSGADPREPAAKPGHRRHGLRPGAVVAAAARAGRRSWPQILAVAIPLSLVSSGLEILIDHYVDPTNALPSLGVSLGATGVSLLGTVLLSGFVCRLVGTAEHRQAPLTFLQVARSLQWWRLITADALVSLAVVAGLVLLVAPGVALLTLLAVVGPVIEIEHRRVLAAIRRSAQLTRHHAGSVLLLATAPLLVVAELEAIAPEPDRSGEIAEFLLIRGLAEGVVEAFLALVLCELCFQLIDQAS